MCLKPAGIYEGFSNRLLADVGGGWTARRDWMGVELAGRQRSSECPQHSPETHQWPSTQLCKHHHRESGFHVLFHMKKGHRSFFLARALSYKDKINRVFTRMLLQSVRK